MKFARAVQTSTYFSIDETYPFSTKPLGASINFGVRIDDPKVLSSHVRFLIHVDVADDETDGQKIRAHLHFVVEYATTEPFALKSPDHEKQVLHDTWPYIRESLDALTTKAQISRFPLPSHVAAVETIDQQLEASEG